jgi:hypothetical protein
MKSHPIDNNEYDRISHFFGLGGKTNKESEYTENRNKTVNAMTKLMQHSAMSVASKNLQQFSTTFSNSNTFSMSNIDCSLSTGPVKIGLIDQRNETTLITETEAKNTLAVSMVSDMSNDIGSAMLGNTKDSGSSLDEITGQAAGVANNLIDTYGDTLQSVLGGDSSESNKQTINANVTKNIENIIENELSKSVNEESIQTAMNDVKNTNETVIANFVCGGSSNEFEGAVQKNVTDALIKSMFSNEKTIDMADKIIQTIEDKFEASDVKQGDLAAAGSALAENINAVGDASQGLGRGIASAAEGVGTGVGTAAEGVGDGVGDAARGVGEGFSAFLKPLMIGLAVICVCFICMAVIWLIMSGATVKNVGDAARGR